MAKILTTGENRMIRFFARGIGGNDSNPIEPMQPSQTN